MSKKQTLEAIEIRQPSRMTNPEVREQVTQVLEDIRRRSQAAGLRVIESQAIESPNSADYRGNPLDDLQRVREINPDIPTPRTVSMGGFRQHPFLPAMAKDTGVAGGKRKYLVGNDASLGKFLRWAGDHQDDERLEGFRDWLVQTYIETSGATRNFGGYHSVPSSYRVIADCTGEVLASHFQYCQAFPMDGTHIPQEEGEHPAHLLEKPSSYRLVNHQGEPEGSAISNRVFLSGAQSRDPKGGDLGIQDPKTGTYSFSRIGGRIVLNPTTDSHPTSDFEKRWLDGMRNEKQELPRALHQYATDIGSGLGVKDGVIRNLYLGLDFVRSSADGRFYFLEANRRPSLITVRDLHGHVDSMTEDQARSWVLDRTFENIARARTQK